MALFLWSVVDSLSGVSRYVCVCVSVFVCTRMHAGMGWISSGEVIYNSLLQQVSDTDILEHSQTSFMPTLIYVNMN